MFAEFFLFELKNRLKRPMVYVFTLISFALLLTATISENLQIGGSNEAVHVNAPYVIMSTLLTFSLIGVFITTAFISTSILRDFESRFDGILFATPIDRFSFLGGRLLGGFTTALIPYIGACAGIALGAMSPWVDAADVGPFLWMPYLTTFLYVIVPNTLFAAAIVFTLAALYRSNVVSFVGVMLILVLYGITVSLAGSLDNESVAVIMDPLAINSYSVLTKYWTIDDKNTTTLPSGSLLLLNRALWALVSFGIIVFGFARFSFSKKKQVLGKLKKNEIVPEEPSIHQYTVLEPLSQAAPLFDLMGSLIQLFHLSRLEFKQITKSGAFKVLLLLAILNMTGSVPNVNQWFGTGNHPVTYLMVDAIRGTYYVFVVALLMFYTGAIVWRERETKIDGLLDATPYPTWMSFASKSFGLLSVLWIVLAIGIAFGIACQSLNGYLSFEIGVYAREFLVYDFLSFAAVLVLGIFVQVLVKNKYFGYFAFLVLILTLKFGPAALEISSNMYAYGNTPSYIYSDMSGWGPYSTGLTWFHLYWSLFALLIAAIGVMFWQRGVSATWRQRLRIASQRFRGGFALTVIALLVLWLGTSGFLFYNTQLLNTIDSSDADKHERIAYEQKYKKYEHIAQPRITDINYDISLYPEARAYHVVADIMLKNKTNAPINEIHINTAKNHATQITVSGAKASLTDSVLHYHIYRLDRPLMPGRSTVLSAQVSYAAQGIENEVTNTSILENGTFINKKLFMPQIGYQSYKELTDDDDREAAGFSPKEKLPRPHAGCSHICRNSYISTDADWVNVSCKISTTDDQIAIAPGALVKEYTRDGRNYYEYELDRPVLDFYSFISGRYDIKKDIWISPTGESVDLEVYYHPGHEYNVDKMLLALGASLSYNAENFAPYPHAQARIVEFPRLASFAQAFPGTMPYSESMGFIANLNDPKDIDMVTYIVAHEIAHQWWAHQVIGANVQGVTLLSETMAQYSALMVMKKLYGRDKMKQFMRYEMDRYLRGRAEESEYELPLAFNENQDYIHYRKGSVIMYALQEYIGEDSINSALRRFAHDKAYQEAPYTNSIELMSYLSAVTPDSLQYLLEDGLETITLYSNKTNSASYEQLPDGNYSVTIDVSASKYRADSTGAETTMVIDDYIDIGIYSEQKSENEKYGRPILERREKITTKETSFTYIIPELPHTAGIDPNYLLIDRFPEDNIQKVERR